MKITKYPEMTWSISRRNIFKECKRKYYYQFYASHNAWLDTSDEEARWVWRLKNLKNIYAVFGDGLHKVIKEEVNQYRLQGSLSQKERLKQGIKDSLNEAFLASKSVNLWMEKPNRNTMLFENFYNGGLSQKVILEIKERIESCVDNFLQAESFQGLLASNSRILELDEVDFRFIKFNNCKLYAILDAFYYRPDEDEYIIVDWKTGKEDEGNRDQLLFYLLYVLETYKLDPRKIKMVNEYLLKGIKKEYYFTQEDLELFQEEIKASVEEMQSYLLDDETNTPKAISEFSPNPGRRCDYCNFFKLCREAADVQFSVS